MNNEDSMGGLGLDVAADVPLSEDRSAINFSNRARDEAMMARCIELSRIAVSKSEYPFATVIAFNGEVVAEAINRTVREGDVTRHAEIIALSQAAEDGWPEATSSVHALFQCRAVRHVLLLHSPGLVEPGGVCHRLSDHGGTFEMEHFA